MTDVTSSQTCETFVTAHNVGLIKETSESSGEGQLGQEYFSTIQGEWSSAFRGLACLIALPLWECRWSQCMTSVKPTLSNVGPNVIQCSGYTESTLRGYSLPLAAWRGNIFTPLPDAPLPFFFNTSMKSYKRVTVPYVGPEPVPFISRKFCGRVFLCNLLTCCYERFQP